MGYVGTGAALQNIYYGTHDFLYGPLVKATQFLRYEEEGKCLYDGTGGQLYTAFCWRILPYIGYLYDPAGVYRCV